MVCEAWTADDLRQWRKSWELSQSEAAEALGVSLRTYSDRERGVTPVSRICMLACLQLSHRYYRGWRA